jgi:hypothetical protein
MKNKDHEVRLKELERRQHVLFKMAAENLEAIRALRDILTSLRDAIIKDHEAGKNEPR